MINYDIIKISIPLKVEVQRKNYLLANSKLGTHIKPYLD